MSESHPPRLHIRQLQADDLEQYNDLLRYAFQVTEDMLLEYGWENDDIRQSKFPVLERARVLGWFDEGRLASQFAVYPLKMNVHGAVYNIGFVTSVATYPEYTGLGLMSQLMQRSLSDMREQGQSLALLYPYSIPLYRHKGFEIISDKMSFRIKDTQLPRDLEAPGYIRRVDDDSPDLIRLHTLFANKTHGSIYRNDLAWEEYWRWDVDDTEIAIYYGETGDPLGYMVYLLKDEVMHIKELVYLNTESWKGLWKYIGAHESMVDEVVGNNYDGEPLAFWLEDSDIKETIRPYIMGRIVDVEQFLSHYRFLPQPTEEAITFHVEDDLLAWNRRSFTVTLRPDARPEITEAASSREVWLSIGTLTTMLLGYKRPGILHVMERIEADEETIALLERILPREKANIADYI